MEQNIIKQYETYVEKIKPNKSFMMAINTLLNKEGILQYSILQFIAHNQNGTDLDLLTHVGIDTDLSKIIIDELLKNELIEEKEGKFYITDSGKSVVIASYFRALELL